MSIQIYLWVQVNSIEEDRTKGSLFTVTWFAGTYVCKNVLLSMTVPITK